ncbi:hypothetical protein [Plantactinospora sp. CA-290183]|uniref:hypothetical protein n=1 Tax=Plantactinospora sp. CA-290183 TaxID=3240006 RepID=UPI003D8EDFC8
MARPTLMDDKAADRVEPAVNATELTDRAQRLRRAGTEGSRRNAAAKDPYDYDIE